jgi:hypothetical protein
MDLDDLRSGLDSGIAETECSLAELHGPRGT